MDRLPANGCNKQRWEKENWKQIAGLTGITKEGIIWTIITFIVVVMVLFCFAVAFMHYLI